MGAAKHAGVFRKGFDESLDDLSLVAGILKRDVQLVTAHQANPQLYFCHTPRILSVAPTKSSGHPPLCNRRSRPANQHRVESVERHSHTVALATYAGTLNALTGSPDVWSLTRSQVTAALVFAHDRRPGTHRREAASIWRSDAAV